ncbi:hypothetical protein ALC53_06331 [Atta colombica]|uniref:Uncharacterized protein n=1 Tax=Atta colombica TaxID=520822 RepID=A0A195BEP6_9HYME|nr:hypothetical protein ALC53_06331 [Atta colombica]
MWWRCDSGGRSRWLWTTATRSRAKVQRVLCFAVRGWCRWLLTEYGCLSDGASPNLTPPVTFPRCLLAKAGQLGYVSELEKEVGCYACYVAGSFRSQAMITRASGVKSL